MKLRPAADTEHAGQLQYWSREDAQDSADLALLDRVAESAILSTPRSRALTAEAWQAPALKQWARLRVMATLLDRETDSNREAKCQRTRFARDADVGIRRSSSGKWSTRNVIQCGKMTCPVCGVRRARSVASRIGACMQRHRAGIECDVWMLTLSPRHTADVPLELALQRLYDAAAVFFRSAGWRAFAREHDVCARVRVLDATHGGRNGCHPHFHIALFPRSAMISTTWSPEPQDVIRYQRERDQWSDEAIDKFVRAICAYGERAPEPERPFELWRLWQPLRTQSREIRGAFLAERAREDLIPAWRDACRKVGIEIPDERAFARRALTLSPSEDAAAYFTKWGLADEVASSPQKAKSHLRLLDLVEAGHDTAGDLYVEFRRAVSGKQWVAGLGDAMAELGVHDEDAELYLESLARRRAKVLAQAGTPIPELLPLDLHVRGYLYPAVLRLGWEQVFAFCDAHAEAAHSELEVQLELDRFLWSQLGSQAPPFAEENTC